MLSYCVICLKNLEIVAQKVWVLCESLFECTSFKLGCNASMVKVKIEYIVDLEMYSFFEKGMEGGVLYISKRCSKANKKYLKS